VAGTSAGNGYAVGTDLFVLSSGSALSFNPVNAPDIITFAGTIADDSSNSVPSGGGWTPGSGSGTTLNLSGNGTLVLTSMLGNTYIGGTKIGSGGTLSIYTLSALGPGGVSLSGTLLLNPGLPSGTFTQSFFVNGGTLDVTSNNVIIPTVITGSNGFTLVGPTGSLTLTSGGNAYTGVTSITSGTLFAGITNAFPTSTQIQIANSAQATLNLQTFNCTIEGLSGAGPAGNVLLGTATLTLNTNSSLSNDFGGVISGTGSLVVNGNGTEILSNANTYLGTTTIDSGATLQFGENNAVPSGSALTLAEANATLDLHGFNGVIDSVSGVHGSNITLGTGLLTVGGASTSSTYSGAISGMGGALTKTGSGTFILGQDSATYTGTTSITGGVLQGGADNVFAPTSLADISPGATLNLAGFNESVRGLSGGGNVTLGTGALTLLPQSTENFSGAITGTGGSVILNSTTNQTQIFSGMGNTYSGPTIITQGILQAGANGAFSPNSPVSVTGQLDLQIYNNSVPSVTGTGLIHLGTGILTLTGNMSTIFSGSMQGTTGGLTLSQAAGTIFTLSGMSSYTGATTINDGSTLQGGAVNAFASGSPFTLNGTGTLDLNGFSQNIFSLSSTSTTSTVLLRNGAILTLSGGATTTFAGVMTDSGGLTIDGGTIFTLDGSANQYSGLTTIDSGTLKANVANAFSPFSPVVINDSAILNLNNLGETIPTLSSTSSSATVLLGSGTLTLTGTTSTTYAGTITGSGGLTFNETATWTLTGSSSYTGLTLINSGTLLAGSGTAFSPSSRVTITDSGTFNLNSFSLSIPTLSSTSLGARVILGSGTLTLTGTVSSTYAGGITGSGGLTLSETGATFTLSGGGLNTYSGLTILNSGMLSAGATGALSPSSSVIINDSAILNLSGYNQFIPSLSSTSSTALVTLGSGTLFLTGNISADYEGAITGTGGLSLSGTQTFILSGTNLNTYSGFTTISEFLSGGATLQAGGASVFSPNSIVQINSRGTLDLNGFPQTIVSLSSPSPDARVLLSATLTLLDEVSTDYQGAITGAGALNINGTGVFTLSGSHLNTYSGVTTINGLPPTGGTLRTSGVDALSSASPVVINNTSTLDLNDFSQHIPTLSSTSSSARVTLGKGTLTLTGNLSSSYAGIMTGTGGLTIDESTGTVFTLSLTPSTYSGLTTINSGALQGGVDNVFSLHSPVLINGGGILDLNNHAESILSLSSTSRSALVKLGTGVLTLTGNTFTSYAGAIIDAGGLRLTGTAIFTLNSTGLNTYQGTTTIASGVLQAGKINAFSPFSPISILNHGVLDLNNLDQSIPSLSSPSTGALVTLGRGTLVLTGGVPTIYDGAITGTGGVTLNETTTFTLRGSGLNIYSGITTLNTGTLSAGANAVFSPFSPVVINANATLDVNGFEESIFSLSSSSPAAQVTLGNGTLIIAGNSTTTFAGHISGTGGLTKAGDGTLTLTGTNTYTGPTDVLFLLTDVNAGEAVFASKLVVDGSLASNQVSVYSGGGLGGPGPFLGNVTIYDGGTDAPGDPVTQVIFGSYIQMPGSTLLIEITPPESDLIQVGGFPGSIALIAGSTLDVRARRGHYSPFNGYTIITADAVLGEFGVTTFSPLLVNPHVLYDPHKVVITFGFGLPTPSCVTGNALKLLNYLNENLFNNDIVQNIAFDLLPSMLAGCPQYLAALESLCPARFATLSLSGIDMGFEFGKALYSRMLISHHQRSKRVESSEVAFLPQEDLLSMAKVPPSVLPRGKVINTARGDKNWDVWAEGFDACLHGKSDSQNPSFGTNIYGALVGVERSFDNGLFGFGIGYGDARVNEKHDLGIGKLGDLTGFIYGSGYFQNWYFDLGLFAAGLKIESERDFVRSLLIESQVMAAAESNHHALQGTVHFATGYDFSTTWGTFEPFILEDWTLQYEEKFEEHASPFNMSLRSRSFSALRSEAGLHTYQSWQGAWGLGTLRETFSYVNILPFGVGKIEAAILGVPGSFSQDSYTHSHNLFHGGLQVFFKRQVECNKTAPFFSLSYDGEIGRGYSSNAVHGMIGLYF
jgi:autotransporter-associated beta strand protein